MNVDGLRDVGKPERTEDSRKRADFLGVPDRCCNRCLIPCYVFQRLCILDRQALSPSL